MVESNTRRLFRRHIEIVQAIELYEIIANIKWIYETYHIFGLVSNHCPEKQQFSVKYKMTGILAGHEVFMNERIE
jgi:hypothetical protein